METKTCSKCGEVKSLDEFCKDKTKKDGYCYSCKMCLKQYRQSEKRKEYQKQYQKKYRQSEKYKESIKRYNQSEKGKETARSFYAKAVLKTLIGDTPPIELVELKKLTIKINIMCLVFLSSLILWAYWGSLSEVTRLLLLCGIVVISPLMLYLNNKIA